MVPGFIITTTKPPLPNRRGRRVDRDAQSVLLPHKVFLETHIHRNGEGGLPVEQLLVQAVRAQQAAEGVDEVAQQKHHHVGCAQRDVDVEEPVLGVVLAVLRPIGKPGVLGHLPRETKKGAGAGRLSELESFQLDVSANQCPQNVSLIVVLCSRAKPGDGWSTPLPRCG